MTWFSKIKDKLTKSSSKITSSISDILSKKKLDLEMLDELEELLIINDIGIETANLLTKKLKSEKFEKDITIEDVKLSLSEIIEEILTPAEFSFNFTSTPHVILLCGVNGNGKTTSVGKLAYNFKSMGKKTLIAACDTFRAAATDQVEEWAKRSGCEIVTGSDNSDPASVAFSAYTKAKNEGYDILLIDTAGRLQNKSNLMDELEKIARVIKKQNEQVAFDAVLVIDGTTGQNAYSQVEKFNEIIKLSSLIITKLDGTTKAGILVGIVNKFKIPVCAIGIGEGMEDLKSFSAKEFAFSLLGIKNE